MANRVLDNMTLPFAVPKTIDPDQDFGPRKLYNDNHTGFDFNSVTGAGNNAIIRAAGAGKITESFNGNVAGQSNYNKLRGTQIRIDHGQDEFGTHWATRYHMLIPNTQKALGPVKLNEPIGRAGQSGTSAKGSHLHFELWRNGVPVNPLAYLSYKGASFAGGGSTPIEEENDMGTIDPDQFNALITRLDITTGILGGLQNAVGDTKKGIFTQVNVAADQAKTAAERSEAIIQHLAGPGGVKNTLNDPNTGVWPQVNKLVGLVQKLVDAEPDAQGNVTVSITQADRDAIAKAVNDEAFTRRQGWK